MANLLLLLLLRYIRARAHEAPALKGAEVRSLRPRLSLCDRVWQVKGAVYTGDERVCCSRREGASKGG